jgi:AAHS family 4-hydroxybenzoate transporter-like MFS transporter
MFCGVTLGGALPGAVSSWLVPIYGWKIIFIIGGVFPLIMAGCAAIWLPESVKYLVLRPDGRARAIRILSKLAPHLTIRSDTQLVVPGENAYTSLSPRQLFSDGLAGITPLLWLCFAVNLMGFYFLVSWMPTLLTGQKLLSGSDAAMATALIQIGGTIGGFVLCRPLDTKGFWPVAILFVAAVPCVALIGYAAMSSRTALMIMVFLAGFCVLGLQFGLNAASAMIYPTAVRSNGSGWAFGVGRFGSILGPILGGALIAMQLSVEKLFLAAAIPFLVGAVACVALARLYSKHFKGSGLGERAPGVRGAVASS